MSGAMKTRFFKTRINARIRHLNRQIAIYYAKKRAESLAKRKAVDKSTQDTSTQSLTQSLDLTVNHNKASKTQRKLKNFLPTLV